MDEKISTYTFFVVLIGLLCLSFLILKPLFTAIVLAFIFAYIFYPVYSWLHRKTKQKRISAIIVTAFIIFVFIVPVLSILFSLVTQTGGAISAFTHYASSPEIDTLSASLSRATHQDIDIKTSLSNVLTKIATFLIQEKGPAFVSSIAEIIIGIFIMFFLLYYLFKGGKEFYLEIKELIPLKKHHKAKLFFEIENMLHAVLYGQLITALVQGTLLGIGFFVAGVPNALFWGFLTVILCLIPYVGTPIVFVPASIYLYLNGHVGAAIGLFLYGAVIITNIDNVIKPKIIGKRAKVHPVIVLLGAIGGIRLFGFIGLILGPIILALLIVFLRFYASDFLHKEEEATKMNTG